MSDQTNYHAAGKVSFKPTPEQKLLKELFDYDFDNGQLKRKNGVNVGTQETRKGYLIIKIKSQGYRLQRIVWAWHFGDPGNMQVDHINGNIKDNRIENLRLANNSQNNANKKNTRGYSKRNGKFNVDIMKNGKHYRICGLSTESQAIAAASTLKRALFGEFSNYTTKCNLRFNVNRNMKKEGMLFDV
jgi:hypothetical protein